MTTSNCEKRFVNVAKMFLVPAWMDKGKGRSKIGVQRNHVETNLSQGVFFKRYPLNLIKRYIRITEKNC